MDILNNSNNNNLQKETDLINLNQSEVFSPEINIQNGENIPVGLIEPNNNDLLPIEVEIYQQEDLLSFSSNLDGQISQENNQETTADLLTGQIATGAGIDIAQEFVINERELIFIDSKVNNYQSLIDEFNSDVEVIILNSETDGLDQITQVLSEQQNISGIHIFGDAQNNFLRLGSTNLTSESLENYSGWDVWQNSLTVNGDILVYACNLAKYDSGKEFIEILAIKTDADIATSDNLTGNSELGVDWNLEYQTGSIETNIYQLNYEGVLATSSASLSGGILTYTADTQVTVNITSDGTNLSITDDDGLTTAQTFALSGITSGIEINTGANDDIINLSNIVFDANIANIVDITIDGQNGVDTVNFTGDVATYGGDIKVDNALAFSGALSASGAISGQGTAIALSGAGAGTYNEIKTNITSDINSSSTINASNVNVFAQDNSKIIAEAGGISLALALGKTDGASVSVGASVAYNDIKNTIRAEIDSSNVTATNNVALNAKSTSTIDSEAWSGSAAVSGSTGSGGTTISLTGAGGATYNDISNTIAATIDNGSNVTTTSGDVSLIANDDSQITADAGGVGVAIAIVPSQSGQASVSAAVGAGIAVNQIGVEGSGHNISATIDNSTVNAGADLILQATSTADIDALALAGAAAVAGGSSFNLALAGAGTGVTNKTKTNITAEIKNSNSSNSVTAGGDINLYSGDGQKLFDVTSGVSGIVSELDSLNNVAGGKVSSALKSEFSNNGINLSADSKIEVNTAVSGERWVVNDAGKDKTYLVAKEGNSLIIYDPSAVLADSGAVSLAIAFDTGSGNAPAVSVGVALADNDIENNITSIIKDSNVSADNDIDLEATSVSVVDNFALSGAISASASGTGLGLSLSGAGTGSFNTINNTVKAAIENSDSTYKVQSTTLGDLNIKASDISTITTEAGGFSVALAYGSTGIAASIGVSNAENKILGGVYSYIDGVQVITASGDLILNATSNSAINALGYGGAAAVGVSGDGTGFAAALSIAVGVNTINKTIKSYIDNATVNANGAIDIKANDNSNIQSVAVGASLAIGGGTSAGLSGTIGASTATSKTNNTIYAYIDNSDVTAANGNLTVEAWESATIDAESVAVSISGSVSGNVGVSLSGGGSSSINIINNDVQAYIESSTVDSADVTHSVDDNPTKLLKGDRVQLSSGKVYKYKGTDVDRTNELVSTINLNGYDYSDTSIWELVEHDIIVDAQSDSSVRAVGGSVTLAGSFGGAGSGAGALGVSLARNFVGYDSYLDTTGNKNKVKAYINNSEVIASGDTKVQASSTDVVKEAYAYAGGVAISGGSIAVNDSDWVLLSGAIQNVEYQENDTPAHLSTGNRVEIADGSVYAYIGDSINPNVDLSSQTYSDIASWEQIETSDNDVGAKIDQVGAVAVGISGGLFSGTGGGIGIYNDINNDVDAYVEGNVDLTAGDDAKVIADENAYIWAKGDAVSLAISIGGAIGVSAVKNTISSDIKAWVDSDSTKDNWTAPNSDDGTRTVNRQ